MRCSRPIHESVVPIIQQYTLELSTVTVNVRLLKFPVPMTYMGCRNVKELLLETLCQ